LLPSSLSPLPFLHSYGPLLSLPSFPTRRSSDLITHSSLARSLVDSSFAHHVVERFSTRPFSCPASVFISPPTRRPPSGSLSSTSDRKSTRLNSSHQIISYAVFCLKKKTTTNTHS